MARLAGDVEGVFGVALHAVGQFERLNAGFQLGIVAASGLMTLVELLQKVELLPLLVGGNGRIANILDEAIDRGFSRVDIGALISARQEAGLPILCFLNR